MIDLLAGAGLSAGTMVFLLGVFFFATDRALAFPSGWMLLVVAFATVVAIAAVTRRWLILLTGGVGGTVVTLVVFITLVLVHTGEKSPGPQFAIIGLVFAIPSAWFFARAHGWTHVAGLLVVPAALCIWSIVPRRIKREPPGKEVIRELAIDEIKSEGGPVEVIAFELGEVTAEHHIAGEGRTYHWTATIEMTADGYWSFCSGEHTRQGYTKEPMTVPEGWSPKCENTPHAKGERLPYEGKTSFTFQEGVGWVGPDRIAH